MPATPTIVRESDAETLDDGPTSRITLLADRDTSLPLTVNRASLQVGSPGAPPHCHHDATELLYVLAGRAHVLLDETVHELAPGDVAIVPPGVPHAFAPTPGNAVELLVIFSDGPPRFDYYRLLQRVHHGQAAVADIAASGPRFDNHYVASPVWSARG